jgi:hypothetical protein
MREMDILYFSIFISNVLVFGRYNTGDDYGVFT